MLPRSLLDTALLLGSVGALSLAIGTGAAWTISLHEFRGRQMLLWLVPLPLAIPTYLAAYVYVDLFEPLGLVHQTLALWLPLQDAVRALPNLRSLPGAIIVIALVLYPYVYLSEEAFPEGIVKLMDHEPTAPQYIVIMTSCERPLVY